MIKNGGLDINACGDEDSSALAVASAHGQYDMAKLLLKKGALVDTQKDGGLTALMSASREGHYRVAKLLLKRGAQVDTQDRDGWSALMFASQEGHSEVVRLLLNSGADIDLQSAQWESALSLALLKGHSEAVSLLEEKAEASENLAEVDKITKGSSKETPPKESRVSFMRSLAARFTSMSHSHIDDHVRSLSRASLTPHRMPTYSQVEHHTSQYKSQDMDGQNLTSMHHASNHHNMPNSYSSLGGRQSKPHTALLHGYENDDTYMTIADFENRPPLLPPRGEHVTPWYSRSRGDTHKSAHGLAEGHQYENVQLDFNTSSSPHSNSSTAGNRPESPYRGKVTKCMALA